MVSFLTVAVDFLVNVNFYVLSLLPLHLLDFNSKKDNFSILKMSNYAEECLKNYVKMETSYQVQIRFEIYPSQILVYYYYDNEEYFDILRTIRNLDKYLRKCNMHLHWRTYAYVGIYNVTGPNNSEIFFNRSIKRLTRLDIKKR